MNSIEKLGSKKHPICVSVWDEEALERVATLCEENGWHFIAAIDPEEDEDLGDLVLKLQYEKLRSALPHQPNIDPKPNNFCPCGSGKKYKKCCMLTEPPATETRPSPQ